MAEKHCSSEITGLQGCGRDEIVKQRAAINNNRQLIDVLNGLPGYVLILNHNRQIVFANRSFLNFLGNTDLSDILGKKPGDALACEHAMQSPFGCGATNFCTTCGAAKAAEIMLQGPGRNIHECRIRQEGSGQAFDFLVQTTPFPGSDDDLHLFFLTDNSHEKRRRALERIFFHDVSNIATGMMGLSKILCEKELESEQKKHCHTALHRSAHRLAREVEAQRALAAAENNDFCPQITACASMEMLSEVADFYNGGRGYDNRLVIDDDAIDVEFNTDSRLLIRILINMSKNAIEASPTGADVRLGCNRDGDYLEFWVYNHGFIPEDVQKQIFKRSFSTKGQGRGLGTYSIKLLGERYLKGKASFTSSPEHGTFFRFRCPENTGA